MALIKSYLIILILTIISPATADVNTYEQDLRLYEEVCTRCHDMEWYLYPRSFKSWQLTVESMREFSYDDDSFTDEQALRIAKFLAKYADEYKILKPALETSKPILSKSARKAPEIILPITQRHWRPTRAALYVARISGFFAFACLAGLFISGFIRNAMTNRFRLAHPLLALGLFLSIATHGVTYIAKYGTPGVLWYWFGMVGFIALIVTQVQGIVRKNFKRGLLIAHIAGACMALVICILHWIWAWI
jgi:hypothetical protein